MKRVAIIVVGVLVLASIGYLNFGMAHDDGEPVAENVCIAMVNGLANSTTGNAGTFFTSAIEADEFRDGCDGEDDDYAQIRIIFQQIAARL